MGSLGAGRPRGWGALPGRIRARARTVDKKQPFPIPSRDRAARGQSELWSVSLTAPVPFGGWGSGGAPCGRFTHSPYSPSPLSPHHASPASPRELTLRSFPHPPCSRSYLVRLPGAYLPQVCQPSLGGLKGGGGRPCGRPTHDREVGAAPTYGRMLALLLRYLGAEVAARHEPRVGYSGGASSLLLFGPRSMCRRRCMLTGYSG